MTAPDQALAALESSMDDVETMIRNSRRALAGGDLMDMTPIGEQVADLCVQVRDLMPHLDDPNAVRKRLEKMVADLNLLEADIRNGAGLPADDDDHEEQGKD
tara:strand:- start:282 stop:587 length:306 start_codon:yes stop_codon:yes gene_type:complete